MLRSSSGGGSAHGFLNCRQIAKLEATLSNVVSIQPKVGRLRGGGGGGGSPINFQLRNFLQILRQRLSLKGVNLDGIFLHGSCASSVLSSAQKVTFNDIDIAFRIVGGNDMTLFNIRQILLQCISEFIPSNSAHLHSSSLEDIYFAKMVKIQDHRDCWSLISLNSNDGPNLDLKFIQRIKRDYEFSVDSFQISLDNLLSVQDILNENIPQVRVRSSYGDLHEAMSHLEGKLICTMSPEQIRGGGLLKYVYLLLSDFKVAPALDQDLLERYMCARFFIDFPEDDSQSHVITNFVHTHFMARDSLRRRLFLHLFEEIVLTKATCLIEYDRSCAKRVLQYLLVMLCSENC